MEKKLNVNYLCKLHVIYGRKFRTLIKLGPIVNMSNYNIGAVRTFIYLGSKVTSDNNTSIEVKRRIVSVNRRLYILNTLLRFKHLSQEWALSVIYIIYKLNLYVNCVSN